MDEKKSIEGEICGTGKLLARNKTLKKWWKMRVVIMKMMKWHA